MYHYLGYGLDFINSLNQASLCEGGWVVPFFHKCEYVVSDKLLKILKARCLEERGGEAIWSLVLRKRGEKDIPCVQIVYPKESEIVTFDLVKEYDD